MLIQHKAELGRKFIPRITIVTDDFEGEWDGLEQDWHIFFHIEDVPPDADEDPDTKSGVEKPEDKNPDDHKPGVGPGKVEARTETNQILRVHRIIV